MFLTIHETLDYLKEAAIKKITRNRVQMFILAVFAGASIGFGAIGSVLASGDLFKVNYGLSKFIAGAVFPVGLIFVVLCQLELFTSNCLMVVGVASKKIKMQKMIETLILVWVGNLVGALIVSFITYQTGTLSPVAKDALFYADHARVSASSINIILKGIMANVLVAGGAFSAYAAKDWSGKMLACWFFIMLFTILGYDHSIANMTYLPTAMMLGAPITFVQTAHNILMATIGNFIGGVIVGLGFYYANKK